MKMTLQELVKQLADLEEHMSNCDMSLGDYIDGYEGEIPDISEIINALIKAMNKE